jgi:hypothetical protein
MLAAELHCAAGFVQKPARLARAHTERKKAAAKKTVPRAAARANGPQLLTRVKAFVWRGKPVPSRPRWLGQSLSSSFMFLARALRL